MAMEQRVARVCTCHLLQTFLATTNCELAVPSSDATGTSTSDSMLKTCITVTTTSDISKYNMPEAQPSAMNTSAYYAVRCRKLCRNTAKATSQCLWCTTAPSMPKCAHSGILCRQSTCSDMSSSTANAAKPNLHSFF